MWHAPAEINTVHEFLLPNIFLNRNRVPFNRVDEVVCVAEHALVGHFEALFVLLLISLLLLHVHLHVLQVVHMFHPVANLLSPDSLLLLSTIKVEIFDVLISQSLLMGAFAIKGLVRRFNPLLLVFYLLLALAHLLLSVKFHFL